MTEAKIPVGTAQASSHIEDTYAGLQQINRYIASSSFDQAVPSAGSLSAIELIDKLTRNRDSMSPAWRAILDDEAKYLNAAANLIATNDAMKVKFGSGVNGVMTVAGFLRQENDDRVKRELIKGSLPETAMDRLGKVRRAIE